MKKLTILGMMLILMIFVLIPAANASDTTTIRFTVERNVISRVDQVSYVEVWGYDTTNNILIPLAIGNVEIDNIFVDVAVEVPSTGGVWKINGTAIIEEYDTHFGDGRTYLHAYRSSTTYNSTLSPGEYIGGVTPFDYINGSAMQLSWENAATVSTAGKTQTLRVDIPNMNKYTLTYQTSSGGAGNITGATTNISLGNGPYTTVTVTVKKDATEIGKKSIGIFVQ